MELFIDTAEIEEIKSLNITGLIDGVTTNPSLIAKSGRNIIETIAEICAEVSGPVSAEVTATDFDSMVKEGRKLSAIADNVTIKVPLTFDGLRACKTFSDDGIMVNVTLCFSAAQAILAAKAGATFISPFIGRLDDLGEDGMDLIKDIRSIYDNYPSLKTEILAASIRSADHVRRAAIVGADISTLPPSVLSELAKHPLTDSGLKAFLDDWEKTGQKII